MLSGVTLPATPVLRRLCVVLVATRNPLNIGAAARAMSNFGCRDLRVVRPFDPAFREAKSAVGAADLLATAREFPAVGDAVADCALVVGTTAGRRRELHHPLRRLESGARVIRKQLAARGANPAGRVAILFGSEKFGLSNDDLSHCHWLMRIPTVEANISMNLGQAVAVCLYELVRDGSARGPVWPKEYGKFLTGQKNKNPKPASAGDFERITGLLLEALRLSGYSDLRRVADIDARMRRLVRRMNLPARDAELWTGIFRQIAWKLRQAENDEK
jgi:TrmH family RNA methyltransferase